MPKVRNSTMQFEKNLSLLRKKNGLSQEELAFAAGVSRQTIYSWEAGLNYPNIMMLKKLAGILNVSTDDLLNGFEVTKLPVAIKDLKLTYVGKHKGTVKYEELPNWFIKLKPEEEVCWALYDIKKDGLIRDYSYYIFVVGNALIHDIESVEISVKEYSEDFSSTRKYNQYVSVKDDATAWTGESYIKDGKRIIKTYKDQDFLKDWGIGGKFTYSKMKYENAEDWILEYEGKKIPVIKVSYFDPDGRDDPKCAYFEAFLNQDLATLVWRRYTKTHLSFNLTGERIVIDGQEYDADYYAITSRLL